MESHGLILLVSSKRDEASLNIAKRLIENHGFKAEPKRFMGNPVYSRDLPNDERAELIFIDRETVDTQDLPLPKHLKLLIFISKHKSASGRPTLSVHTPGNLGEASLGGLPRRVSVSPASAMKEALVAMKTAQEEMGLEYEVSYECTHHGPSLDVPTMFVELGSSLPQWRDPDAAEAVAIGALAAASTSTVYPTVLGIGGPHYNGRFTRRALNSDIAFGHIISKYAVELLDEEMLRQCVERTVEHVEKAILDWKGIKGSQRSTLLEYLRNINLEFERI